MKYNIPPIHILEEIHKKLIQLWLDQGEWWSFWYHKTQADLESVLYYLDHEDYYPTFIEKITYFVYSINKNHIFIDGNKRSSIYFASFFLEINQFQHISEIFLRQMEEITVHVADNRINKDLLWIIVEKIVENSHSSERFIESMREYRDEIEKDKIWNELLEEIILSLLYEDDYSEELKIKILNAIKQS